MGRMNTVNLNGPVSKLFSYVAAVGRKQLIGQWKFTTDPETSNFLLTEHFFRVWDNCSIQSDFNKVL